jgi:NhaP-type Na+/H+ or K+/H+ antiporter
MTRRQTRAVVLTQAFVLAAVGLAAGVPLGVALGRVLWRLVAAIAPLQFRAPDVSVVLLLAVPVALAVVAALAVRPGRRAARLRVGELLRTE